MTRRGLFAALGGAALGRFVPAAKRNKDTVVQLHINGHRIHQSLKKLKRAHARGLGLDS